MRTSAGADRSCRALLKQFMETRNKKLLKQNNTNTEDLTQVASATLTREDGGEKRPKSGISKPPTDKDSKPQDSVGEGDIVEAMNNQLRNVSLDSAETVNGPALPGEAASHSGSGSGAVTVVSLNKRGRDSNATPPNDSNAKKSKVTSSPAFSTVVKRSLQVLVSGVDGRVLDQSLVQELLKTLYVWLDGVLPGALRPTFEGHRFNNGIFIVDCANSDSVSWLINAVKEIGSVSGFVLSAVCADSVPPKRKVAFTVADPDGAKPEILFRRLREYNDGLDTSGWVYLTRLATDGPRGSTHLVAIDRASEDFIRRRGKRLYYMVQKVPFDFRGPHVVGQHRASGGGNSKGKPKGNSKGSKRGGKQGGGSSSNSL